jgi:hypothetical protein
MINIIRKNPAPSSLQVAEIKDYIDALTTWKENPEDNPKPKPPVSYRNSDVLDAFDEYFFAKCYLTEQRFVSSYAMDIEHFYPKSQFPEKRYDWSNLYPADHNANMAKPNLYPENGYLDPCDPNDDVENEIRYAIDFSAKCIYFEAVNRTNMKAVNTAELLHRIHNGHNHDSIQKTKELRTKIYITERKIMEEITHWLAAKNKNDGNKEFLHRKILQGLLSRKSSFTMLMRSNILVQEYLFPKADFFD